MDKIIVAINLVGMGLHVADLYADFATTILYWKNCQFKFLFFSIGIFINSYLVTVYSLMHVIHKKENFSNACLYPYHVLRIMVRKLMISLKSEYLFTYLLFLTSK